MNLQKELEYCFNCKTKPCQNGCPLGNDIPNVISLMKEGKFEEAYDKISETTILSSACGRICPHTKQCQGKCTRGIKGEPVSIGKIESYLADVAFEKNFKLKKFECFEENIKKNKKVAVIGGGPAGLTCAGFLARSGVDVTIYEKFGELGGIMMHGIPEFRLSKDKIKFIVQNIIDLGVEVKYNQELGKNLKIEDLLRNYDYIFLGIGANVSAKMNIKGEELQGVFGANEVLESKDIMSFEGKNVAVIGGGNVAMDMARTANKENAKNVYVIYRRAEEQMPAEKKEIDEAKEEGVKFLFQNNIVKAIANEKGKLKKIECVKTELIKKDGEDRLVPVNIDGSNYFLDIDMVFMAVGSKVDEHIARLLNLETGKQGNIIVDDEYKTSNEKIFAAGDLIGEKSTVAWASKSGREAAYNILKKI